MPQWLYFTLATLASLLMFACMFPNVTLRGEVQANGLIGVIFLCCIPFIFAYLLTRHGKR
jgi:hypothetical protein